MTVSMQPSRMAACFLALLSSLSAFNAGCSKKLDVGWNDEVVEVDASPTPSVAPTASTTPTAAPTQTAETDGPPPVDPPDAALPTEGGASTVEADASDAAPALDDFPLPFDPSTPMIVNNDGPFDNWQGEHAILAAARGQQLVGLIINWSWAWQDLDSNLAGWQELVAAARADGIQGIPDPLRSDGQPLQAPASGIIEDTTPNRSAGAEFIVDTVAALEEGGPPLVVVTGGRLTDVADAYLIDPSIAERMIVVSSLGRTTDEGANMNVPNGEMDTWADIVVSTRLRYVQVSGYYNQIGDVPPERVAELPGTALGAWVADKQSLIANDFVACDQVSILAATTPGFVIAASRVAAEQQPPFIGNVEPTLVPDESSGLWLVSEVDGSIAAPRLWELLDGSL